MNILIVPLDLEFIGTSEMDFTISVPQCENCNADACVCPTTLAVVQNINELSSFGTTGINTCSCEADECNCFVCGVCNRTNDECQCELENEVFTYHPATCDKCGESLIDPHPLPSIYCEEDNGKKHELCLASELCPVCDKDQYHELCCFNCDPSHDDYDNTPKEYECQYCYSMLSSPDELCWCSEKAKYGGCNKW
jgi:hypothetical protein